MRGDGNSRDGEEEASQKEGAVDGIRREGRNVERWMARKCCEWDSRGESGPEARRRPLQAAVLPPVSPVHCDCVCPEDSRSFLLDDAGECGNLWAVWLTQREGRRKEGGARRACMLPYVRHPMGGSHCYVGVVPCAKGAGLEPQNAWGGKGEGGPQNWASRGNNTFASPW